MFKLQKIVDAFFWLVLFLYLLLGKGIAYFYLSEVFIVTAVGAIIIDALQEKRILIFKIPIQIVLLQLITIVSIIVSSIQYPIVEVIRDSMIIMYSIYCYIIVFLIHINGLKKFLDKLGLIFKLVLYPLFFLTFLQEGLNVNIPTVPGTESVYIFYLKHGDLAVYISIYYILAQEEIIKFKNKFLKAISFLFLLFLTVSAVSHNKGGMVSLVLIVSLYHLLIRRIDIKILKRNFIYLLMGCFALVVLLGITKKNEDFQGRSTSIEQLIYNLNFFVKGGDNDTSEDNVLWRVIWWERIIDYTIYGPYFFTGKGLGFSLAVSDNVPHQEDETSLIRSPHNINMSILARFGVIATVIWLLLILKLIFDLIFIKIKLMGIFILFSLSCFINGNFDVYLEGPMGAIPFWIFISLYYYVKNTNLKHNVATKKSFVAA